MADKFDKETRSYIMSRIKGKWTSPERKIHNTLKGNRINHKMHPKLFGNPDVYIHGSNTVVFVDGCFWHGCPEHSHRAKTNRAFWDAKIARNMERDAENTQKLVDGGYNVVRVWECELMGQKVNIKPL